MNKKTFEVDFDSLDDCLKVLNQLKSRMGELHSRDIGSRNDRKKSLFSACQKIYETDITSVYSNLNLDLNPVYYVYTHSDPDKNIAIGKCGKSTFAATLGMTKLPFYVGKGAGDRAYDLNRNETHRKVRQNLHRFNKEINVGILQTGLTEIEALMIESKLIDIFGLITTGGRLVNLDEGINSKERRLLYKDELHEISSFYRNSV